MGPGGLGPKSIKIIRSYENLLQQFTVGNLANPIKKPVKLNQHEYIISVSDDDCEDGVCKL